MTFGKIVRTVKKVYSLSCKARKSVETNVFDYIEIREDYQHLLPNLENQENSRSIKELVRKSSNAISFQSSNFTSDYPKIDNILIPRVQRLKIRKVMKISIF